MKPKTKIVATCLQCQEDELLDVRDGNRQYIDIINVLDAAYQCDASRRKPEITAAQIVERLCKAEKDQRRLCKLLQDSAKRVCKEADDLIAAIQFLRSACNREHGSVHLSAGKITLDMSDLLNLIIERVRSLVAGDRGLLEGRQPHNDVDFLADIWKED